MRKKHPYQIYLDDQQFQALKFLAKQRDVAVADILRESVAKYLAEAPIADDPAMKIIALGSSGKGDISARHDDYLAPEPGERPKKQRKH